MINEGHLDSLGNRQPHLSNEAKREYLMNVLVAKVREGVSLHLFALLLTIFLFFYPTVH